ncbi:Methyl-accepting chemotaxis protein [Borrelia duttonii CR2A]|uniref:Methyl-accepting chemotaxis protein n=1 Tax=Borrelia duttonii CR2A TaxID=1432657 RepID=W6TJB3_9SPIR|nr:hypothetical protein [Borrelia duttonii]ETZ18758.1 Methyl-accepting chemotaxis protein [Borrelia duttonii CR2A]
MFFVCFDSLFVDIANQLNSYFKLSNKNYEFFMIDRDFQPLLLNLNDLNINNFSENYANSVLSSVIEGVRSDPNIVKKILKHNTSSYFLSTSQIAGQVVQGVIFNMNHVPLKFQSNAIFFLGFVFVACLIIFCLCIKFVLPFFSDFKMLIEQKKEREDILKLDSTSEFKYKSFIFSYINTEFDNLFSKTTNIVNNIKFYVQELRGRLNEINIPEESIERVHNSLTTYDGIGDAFSKFEKAVMNILKDFESTSNPINEHNKNILDIAAKFEENTNAFYSIDKNLEVFNKVVVSNSASIDTVKSKVSELNSVFDSVNKNFSDLLSQTNNLQSANKLLIFNSYFVISGKFHNLNSDLSEFEVSKMSLDALETLREHILLINEFKEKIARMRNVVENMNNEFWDV